MEEIKLSPIEKENTYLRGLLQKVPNWKCTYGYQRVTRDGPAEPLDNMGQCPLGFPGCSCADDIMAAEDMMLRVNRGQAAKHSFVEVLFNYAIGFVIAFFTQWIVLNAAGFHASATESFWITVVFTIVSIIRSFLVRRLFNWLHVKGKL